jgi:hypothetical protein
MLDWMILYLVVAYLGTLLLGYLQTRKPDTMSGTETSHEDLYATAAVTAASISALACCTYCQ